MIDKMSFAKIMAGLRAAYPRFKLAETVESLELWHKKLQGYDYEILSTAVSHWIDTEKFPPSIADIKGLCEPKESPLEESDWGTSWEYALKSVQHYGYYRQSEAMEYLKEHDFMAYKVLRRLGYQTVCLSEDITRERANFRMMFESIENRNKRIKEYCKLPERLRSIELGEHISLSDNLDTRDKGGLRPIEIGDLKGLI